MFRYLNQAHMCSEREATAKGIFSAPFGSHLGIMQNYTLYLIRLCTCICYVGDISETDGE